METFYFLKSSLLKAGGAVSMDRIAMLMANSQCHDRSIRSRVDRKAFRMTGWRVKGLQNSTEDWLVSTSRLERPASLNA